MVFSTPINNIIIDGNSFDYGTYTPDGNPASTSITYSYFNCVGTTSDTSITNNYFSGMAAPAQFGAGSSSANLVLSGGTSSIVKNNIFIRDTTTIYAYIVCNSTDDQIITDNVFDGYHVDGTTLDNGTDENLVKGVNPTPTGLSVGSTYNNNKNQTAYSMLPILVGEKLWSSTSVGPYNDDGISDNSTFGSAYANAASGPSTYATLTLVDANQHGYFRVFNISEVIPIDTQILEIKQGIYATNTGDPIDQNTTTITITITSGFTDYDVTGYSSMLDAQTQCAGLNPQFGVANTQQTVLTGPGLTAIQAGTYYLVINSAIQNNLQYYFNTLQSSLTISIGYVFKLSTYSGLIPTGVYFSPIRIKYRW
jgi:hypothetical protein